MQTYYDKWYSPALNRDMECKIYGHAGRPVLFIPCQDGRFYDFENYKMSDVWYPWIESGKVFVVAIDTIDLETWSNKYGDGYWRIRRHEDWIRYITDEVVPYIQRVSKEYNQNDITPSIMTFGCSLGASHAANLYFRRPELFDRCLALSGIYTGEYGFEGYFDDVLYQNSPVHYLANMPADHPYVAQYNRNKAVICAGQGPWEIPETTKRLAEIFKEKGINNWVDLWGYDVRHDWDWWYKQVVYYLPYLLDEN
ncbi:MAG: esterase family protein [Lachnospiraceae bacterium]|nr:esterase family protein [Lachnospiraceae bacterium]